MILLVFIILKAKVPNVLVAALTTKQRTLRLSTVLDLE